jgi:hypothetical protein
MKTQNYINHIVMVLDMSGSMQPHARELIKVADGQIAHLARRSKELNQETRVTVYVFNRQVECIIYDMDVLRLPSIASFYHPTGGTALIDATVKAIDELGETPERYGDHAFLIYVLTDGEENSSALRFTPGKLTERITALPEHWTVAALVPNQIGKHEAKRFGFPPDNIAIWNPESAGGVEEVGRTIRDATESFMVSRAAGVRGSKSLFSTGVDAVNKNTVKVLTPLSASKYKLTHVTDDSAIKSWVEDQCGLKYKLGSCYYELMKTETIQPQKDVAVLEIKTGKVYSGPAARDLLGLPDMQVRVKPDKNPEYKVFVQSTSVNRKLIAGTKLLIIK